MPPARALDPPTGLLVDGDWLEANLERPGLRVLDVRGRFEGAALPPAKRDEYGQAHVPGAALVDWTRDFVNLHDPLPNQLAEPDQFAADAGALGIAGDEVVVTYDDYYGLYAARVARALRCHGVDPGAPPAEVVTTCGVGLSAPLTMIALELVGLEVRGVFDGGWTEWSADPTLPVVYGDA